ncbi:hypothetical protein HN51_066866 [Arachis hypogaea]
MSFSVKLGKLSLGGAAPKSSSTIYIWLHDSLGFPITVGCIGDLFSIWTHSSMRRIIIFELHNIDLSNKVYEECSSFLKGGKAAKKTSASARGKGKPVVGGAGSSKASRSSNSSKVIELTGI